MGRFKQVFDVSTGKAANVPLTPQEEIEADQMQAPVIRSAPRDPLKELDALKAALAAKGVLKPEDLT